MTSEWPTSDIESADDAFQLLAKLRGKRWLCRGQPRPYRNLFSSLDRLETLRTASRLQNLTLERQSIDLFRSAARFFSSSEEESSLRNDITALMVLRHYGVPTRLLDWSMSPYVAAYFACHMYKDEDGEIWGFDEPLYEEKGREQWNKWPETTIDGTGHADKFSAQVSAFKVEEPPDWFVCHFYERSFPRQYAQDGAYSMKAQFGHDHADAIAKLLTDPSQHHLYIVKASLKEELLKILQERPGIWEGSLFPDSAGAAALAKKIFD